MSGFRWCGRKGALCFFAGRAVSFNAKVVVYERVAGGSHFDAGVIQYSLVQQSTSISRSGFNRLLGSQHHLRCGRCSFCSWLSNCCAVLYRWELWTAARLAVKCQCILRQYRVAVFKVPRTEASHKSKPFHLFILGHARRDVRPGLISMQTECSWPGWTDSAVVQHWWCP